METVEGGYIRHFPKKQKYFYGDNVIAIKTNSSNLKKGGEYYEANKQYKVYDVMQCDKCGEEYINIYPNHNYSYQSYCDCSKCNEQVFTDNKKWSNANDFKTPMELRRIKIEQIKYKKLNLFGKLVFKIKKRLNNGI